MPTAADDEPVIIEVATGDIGRTALEGGPWLAVVSSDDSMLSHAGGSSASIWEAAGELEVPADLVPARLGAIVRTPSGDLPSDILLHAVTIDVDRWVGLDSVEYASMVDRLGNILEHWSQRSETLPPGRLQRVLLPALGTGAGGISTSLAVREGERLASRLAGHRIRLVLATPWTLAELTGLAGHHLEQATLRRFRGRGMHGRAGRQATRFDAAPSAPPVFNLDQEPDFSLASIKEADRKLHVALSRLHEQAFPPEDVPGSQPEANRTAHSHQAPHVERLVDLLHSLEGLERDDLDEWMESLGYRGEPRLRLKELCVRMDPAEVVERLGAARIRHLLRSEFNVDAALQTPLAGLITRLLRECGFQEILEPRGLESAILDISRLSKSLVMSEPHDRAGIVLDASGRLETVVRDLLRFVCLHVFQAGPERHLKGAAGYDGRPLSSTTLGMMLTLLRELAASFTGATEATFVDLDGPLTSDRLVPEDYGSIVDELVPIRNEFAHAREQGDATAGGEVSLARATRFLSLVDRLFAFWRDAPRRVYPTIVRVNRITIDRWNRRLIEAVNDAGTEEAIVCDQEIHPGRLYYMLPRTNPFRVDPILVEFGRADVTASESSSNGVNQSKDS